MRSIDIIVVSYGTEKQVERLEQDLKVMTDYPYLLHVFDNNGNKKTLTIAWNDLASACRGEYLAFLNPDIAISPGWAKKIVSLLETHPEIGAVIPTPFTSARPIRPFRDVVVEGNWSNPPSSADMWQIAEKFSSFQGHDTHHFCCGFYAVVMRRSTWSGFFGFDERLTLYGQDHDFQERMKSVGLSTVQVRSIPFWSEGGASTRIAISRRELDLKEEHRRGSEILGALRSGGMPRWHTLSDADRRLVRENPRYNRIAR